MGTTIAELSRDGFQQAGGFTRHPSAGYLIIVSPRRESTFAIRGIEKKSRVSHRGAEGTEKGIKSFCDKGLKQFL